MVGTTTACQPPPPWRSLPYERLVERSRATRIVAASLLVVAMVIAITIVRAYQRGANGFRRAIVIRVRFGGSTCVTAQALPPVIDVELHRVVCVMCVTSRAP